MTSFRQKGSRLRQLALPMAMAAILLGAPAVGWAQVQLDANAGGDLATIIDDATTGLNNASNYDFGGTEDVLINITADQTYTPGTPGSPPQAVWFIHGGAGTTITDNSQSAFNSITIDGNKNAADTTLPVINSTLGVTPGTGNAPLLEIINVDGTIAINNLNLTGGDLTHDGQQWTGGSALYIGATTRYPSGAPADGNLTPGAAADFGSTFTAVNLSGLNINNNHVDLTTNTATARAGMGAMVIDGTDYENEIPTGTANLFGVNLTNNSVSVTSPSGSATYSAAFGGGGVVKNVDTLAFGFSNVTGNTAYGENISHAHGGGLVIDEYTRQATIAAVLFQDNKAEIVNEGLATSYARGGGLYAYNDGTNGTNSTINIGNNILPQTQFINNVAKASGTGDVAALGGGAAIMLAEGNTSETTTVDVQNTLFQGNRAEGPRGDGGGIFTKGVTSQTYSNTEFIGNTASSNGGAIYAMTDAQATNVITLDASLGRETILRDNLANGQSSGIHITNGADIAQSVALNVTGAGNIMMEDAMTVLLTGAAAKSFTLDSSTNTGNFHWDRANVITVANGTSTINLTGTATDFGRNYSLTANGASNAMSVTLGNGASTGYTFHASRDENVAFFDYTAADTGSAFTITAGTEANFGDTSRELLDFNREYLFIDDAAKAGLTSATALNTNTTFTGLLTNSSFDLVGNQIILNASYISPHTASLYAAGRNTISATNGLDTLLKHKDAADPTQFALTDGQVNTIMANLGTVTAEYGMASAREAVNTTGSFHKLALRKGTQEEYITNLWAAPPAGGPAETGTNVWAAYVGNFRNVDDSDGYYGYDQKTNGGMIGLSHDIDPAATISIYGGATKGELEFDRLNSQVDSNGVHVGAALRVSPMMITDPGFSVFANVGYSQYENDGERVLAPYTVSSSYDQKAFTVAAGAEYQLHLGNDVRLTPEFELRYTNLKQDEILETGLTASRVNGFETDSVVSNLGATLSKTAAIQGGYIVPSLKVGWRHEFGDKDSQSLAQYRDPNNMMLGVGQAHIISAVPVDRDTLDVGVGMKAMYDTAPGQQIGLNLSYDLSISKNTGSHGVYGGMEFKF